MELMPRWRNRTGRSNALKGLAQPALHAIAESIADGCPYGVVRYKANWQSRPPRIPAPTASRLQRDGYVEITDRCVYLVACDAHGHRRIRKESLTDTEILTYLRGRGGWVPMRDLFDDLTLKDEDLGGLLARNHAQWVPTLVSGSFDDPHVRITIAGEWELAGYNEGVTA